MMQPDSDKKVPTPDFQNALDSVEESARNFKGDDDVVGFCTTLDVCLDDITSYSDEQKLLLMDKLGKIFTGNHDLLRLTAWDLPSILIQIFDSPWTLIAGGLKSNPCVVKFMHLCELLALYGDPKTLLLASCDQLSSLRMKGDIHEYVPYRNLLIQYHSIIEIITSCLRRNVTLHPATYLGAAVSAIIAFIQSDDHPARTIAVVRRIYTFIRDYIPPDLPEGLPPTKDLASMVADENYLQRRLLTLLLLITVKEHTRDMCTSIIALLVSGFPTEPVEHHRTRLQFIGRLLTLGMSMDLDYAEMMENQIDEASRLFDGKDTVFKSSDDIFAVVIDSYNASLHRQEQKLVAPAESTVILYTSSILVSKEKFSTRLLRVLPLIHLQLKLFMPYTIRPQLLHLPTVACCMVLTLEALKKDAEHGLDRPENELIVLTYLQTLSALCLNSSDNSLKAFFYRYVVKLLSVSSESLAYRFLVDTITHCPFEDLRVRCIRILSDLMDRKKPAKVSELGAGVEKLRIDGPPALPPRGETFITCTPERSEEILKMMDMALSESLKRPLHSGERVVAYIELTSRERARFDGEELSKRVERAVLLAHALQRGSEAGGEEPALRRRLGVLAQRIIEATKDRATEDRATDDRSTDDRSTDDRSMDDRSTDDHSYEESR